MVCVDCYWLFWHDRVEFEKKIGQFTSRSEGGWRTLKSRVLQCWKSQIVLLLVSKHQSVLMIKNGSGRQ